jgi:hypothetical protein
MEMKNSCTNLNKCKFGCVEKIFRPGGENL